MPITAKEIYAAAGALAGIGLAAGAYAYASLWPTSRLFGNALTAPKCPNELALTFDDGPNHRWTPQLLETLERHQVRATFFLLGRAAQAQPALVRRIAAGGHLIGNHSWDHPNLSRTSARRIHEELRTTQDELQQTIGAPVHFFRPPLGARRPAVFRIASELGLQPVLWNAMTSDWSESSAQRIADSLTKKIDGLRKGGWAANIVLHDGGHDNPDAHREPSATAAGILLERYKPLCRFVTIDAWG
jgi:peptidoglycan/xylan/chitin deacetylase (PgdA/CDA1 family)